MEERTLAREAAFRALFQLEFNNGEETEYFEDLAIQTALEDFPKLKTRHIRQVNETVKGTRKYLEEIDKLISEHLKEGWKISRLAITDRNILRLGVYEMCFAEKILTPGIVINEAVNLTKSYGSSDDSWKFVNGVLNAISETRRTKI